MTMTALYITITALAVLSFLLFITVRVIELQGKTLRRDKMRRDLDSIEDLPLLTPGLTKEQDIQKLDKAMNEYDHSFIPSSDKY